MPDSGVPIFPPDNVSRDFELSFVDQQVDESMRRSSTEDGHLIVERRFTFDPREFLGSINRLDDAEREALLDFYTDYATSNIALLHPTEDIYYEVKFTKAPTCRSEAEKGFWRMEFAFLQVSTTTWEE